MKETLYNIPTWESIPNIGLYSNQTVTILEEYLVPFICNEDEKLITSTMINNYVKHNIVPAPVNKKYKREHIAMLYVICILKQVYNFKDIQSLINVAFSTRDICKAYEIFRETLINVLSATFFNKDIDISKYNSPSKYLLLTVTTSYATKLFASKTIHKKEDN